MKELSFHHIFIIMLLLALVLVNHKSSSRLTEHDHRTLARDPKISSKLYPTLRSDEIKQVTHFSEFDT
jgi:hypothetical protein